jgi:hypothetical protein
MSVRRGCKREVELFTPKRSHNETIEELLQKYSKKLIVSIKKTCAFCNAKEKKKYHSYGSSTLKPNCEIILILMIVGSTETACQDQV